MKCRMWGLIEMSLAGSRGTFWTEIHRISTESVTPRRSGASVIRKCLLQHRNFFTNMHYPLRVYILHCMERLLISASPCLLRRKRFHLSGRALEFCWQENLISKTLFHQYATFGSAQRFNHHIFPPSILSLSLGSGWGSTHSRYTS